MALNDRERNFENRFAQDEEMRFRIEMRRNKLLALWAAGQLGLTGAEAETYAQGIVQSMLQPGKPDVFALIRRDFDKANVTQSDHQIHRHGEELLAEAEAQIRKS